jgi:hypothetical protein
MAYNKKYPNIKRTGGPYPRNRYGVRYDSISKQQRRLLLEHPIIKERAQDDQFLQIVFELCRPRNATRDYKFYYDWSTDSFVQMEELKDNYDTIEWECAFSGRKIMSSINDFSPENFVHPEYHDVINKDMIDGRIVRSSIEFRKKAKKALLKQQKDFLKIARKNSETNLD